MIRIPRLACGVFIPAILTLGLTARAADEGMWTFDNLPVKQLERRYGFVPTQQWLDHVRLSSVRFNDGGSGSFVSPRGLVLTNHHVAFGQLQKVSTPEKDYAKNGFHARSQAEELKCPNLELNVLVSMDNVTSRVAASVKKRMADADALKARKAEMAKIEKESLDATGLRSDVVPLYHGGEYWLYRYKKYTDIRLVFAPEQQIAFFGGDPDNFTFPRYCLDFAFFRVYENERPVENQHHLKWNQKGAADGELVFVSGHPGTTQRLHTVAQLESERDYFLPSTIKLLKRRLEVLKRYSARGPEPARQAANAVFSIENSLKAIGGEYEGLLDKDLMAKKRKEEAEFRALVAGTPEWNKKYGDAWETIARAEAKSREITKWRRFRALRGAHLAALAMAIAQFVAEVKKPDAERLDDFHEAELESLRLQLFSPAPVYPEMDEALLSDALQESLEELGPNDPFIGAALAGRAPAEVARKVIAGTRLGDPAFRKSLVEGGQAAVSASDDPLIALALKVDPIVREGRKTFEDNVESVETAAAEKIGQARFAAYGKSAYPDATFTLRLAYGTVRGFPTNGTVTAPQTTFYGLYDRTHGFDGKPPFDLPARYVEGRGRLDLSTPFNFVNTADIIGGNSGSPVINRQGELVGLIFDGNIYSLVGAYVYNEVNNRAVAVHSAAIVEVLRKLYDAGALANELSAD